MTQEFQILVHNDSPDGILHATLYGLEPVATEGYTSGTLWENKFDESTHPNSISP